MDDKRIRLVFKDDDILSETQKSDGLNRSWLLLKPQPNDTVSDLASHLLRAFHLHQSCPNGLLLSVSGFALPPFESSRILKDNEIIRVHKRRTILTVAGNNAADGVHKLKVAEKQPVNNGVLLLANGEFENEKGGYESDYPEEDEEEKEDPSKDVENPLSEKHNPRSLKRKAPEKLRGSTKKKRRADPSGSGANDNEESLLEGGISKKKRLPSEEKNNNSNAKDNVENNEETGKSSKSRVPEPDIKGKDEIQENGKDAEDGEVVPKEKGKPSRSARRKKKTRQWLKEMAKIQKQNATCESEGLRNWKEDHAKEKNKNVAGQFKEQLQQKWKKHQTNADRDEVDDQPKGLLHWKQSPQENWSFNGKNRQQRNQNSDVPKHLPKQPSQNGIVLEKSTQNSSGLEQPNKKQGDLNEQPDHIGGGVKEQSKQNSDALELLNQDSDDDENEVVPIVIRPGHIRFESVGKEQVVQQNHAPSHDTFQWNGITSKKKGQQWGRESRVFTPRNDYKSPNKECSDILSHKEEKQPVKLVDFDKLPLLTTMPKLVDLMEFVDVRHTFYNYTPQPFGEGDLIAYCILELSSTWTPEMSKHRVGKVSWYNAESNQILLVPVPEYPIDFEKADEGEGEDVQPGDSIYNDDGSLEIDFSLLLDTRVFENGSPRPVNEAFSQLSEGSLGNVNTAKTVYPSSTDEQSAVPSTETGVNIWDELGEALSAKKDKLSKENGWGKTPKKVQPPPAQPDNNWGKGSRKVQPLRGSGWEKNAEKVQSSRVGSSVKQGSSGGGKPRSYEGLRGGGLGSTMALLRSKNDT